MLLKAVLKDGSSKDGKTFTLHNIDFSCDELKMTIREQLSKDITVLKKVSMSDLWMDLV